MSDLLLRCSCGKVAGVARHLSVTSGNRLVCYCKDCQAFATYLEREEEIVNAFGGTDIFQMPVAHVQITSGIEYVRCMRLSPTGMHRWYTQCCKTPIGNTLTAGVPFIGLISTFVRERSTLDTVIGPVRVHWLTKSAKGTLPKEYRSTFPFLRVMRVFPMMLVWKLKGLHKPSSFFLETGVPIVEPVVLYRQIK